MVDSDKDQKFMKNINIDISNDSLVVKSNHIIEASYNLPLNGHRLLAIAISNIRKNDNSFKLVKIKAKDMAEIFDLKRSKGVYKDIENVVDELMDAQITMRYRDRWVKYQWVNNAAYKDGIVYLKFNDDLLPYLTSLIEFYTAYSIKNVIGFTSAYQFRIYDLCKQYLSIGERIVSIDEIRRMICIPDDKYKMVGHLKDRIIIPSIEAISKCSDIYISLGDDIKSSRKITALKFLIKKSNIEKSNYSRQEMNVVNGSLNDMEGPGLIDALVKFGVTKSAAMKIINDYDQERIKAAVAYAEAQHRAGKINNPAGFVINAIKNEYKDIKSEEQERKIKEKIEEEKKNKADEDLKKRNYRLKEQAVEDFLNSLDKDKYEELLLNFVETFKNNKILINRYSEQGLNSPMVKGSFYDFIFNKISSKVN